MKNSRTVNTREILEDLTKEFESICSEGDIIYLGTPQSRESIYNNLPSRGYAIRIWPGRYPTEEQELAYGANLAPMLMLDMVKNPELRRGYGLDMSLGAPTCPEMFPEELLIEKEISQGRDKFMLQYMLNTSLSDAHRYPLKIENLIVADMSMDMGPALPIWSHDERNLYKSSTIGRYKLYRALPHQYELLPFERTIMFIDPAGGGKNADEMAYAVIKLIGAYVYIVAIGGVPGGYDEESLQRLVQVAIDTKANTVLIEKNFGNGAHCNMLKPMFQRSSWPVDIEEVYNTGQKELRIIDTLEPLLSSHRLIISSDALEHDGNSVEGYSIEVRVTYRLLHQMAMITRDRNCLRHDDRLDALAGAVAWVVSSLDFDTKVMLEARRQAEDLARIKAWSDPVTRRIWLTGIGSVSTGRNSLTGPRMDGRRKW